MASNLPRSPTRRRALIGEALLLLGFVLLLAAAIVSVVVPELGKEPETESARPAGAGRPAP
jgi:hypothetical protein